MTVTAYGINAVTEFLKAMGISRRAHVGARLARIGL